MTPEAPSIQAKWHAFDNGAAIGLKGSEQGVILLDEEHSLGARITLERGGCTAPFSITCGIYDLFVHTAFAANEPEALQKYAEMKEQLDQIITSDTADGSSQLQDFVNAF